MERVNGLLLWCAFFIGSLLLSDESSTVQAAKYPRPILPYGNVTVLATAHTKRFIHVFATAEDRGLYHKYTDLESSPTATTWSDWSLMYTQMNGTWEGDPCVGVNQDGTVEVFIRYSTGLDLWQIYQLNADDPNAWSKPRECTCPSAPNCPQPWDTYFWNSQPVFPTSDCQIVNDPVDGRLEIFLRGFTGEYFRVRQRAVNDHNYLPPENFGQEALME